jgi:spore coat protein U-like protein
MAFTEYAPLTTHSGTALTKDSIISAHCTLNTTATISLNVGQNPVSADNTATPARRMSNGASGLLAYNIYKDAGHTAIWGAGAGNGSAYTGNGASENVLMFGKIGAGLVVPNGTYTDTVTVSIELG